MSAVTILLLALLGFGSPGGDTVAPTYTAENRLRRPLDYREWIWLSSGLGMAYGPLAQDPGRSDPPFENVFVTRSAYREFLQTGTWPDLTTFALEVRSSASNASINKAGHFQADLRGIEVEVKDLKRFGGWAFFEFGGTAESASALPHTAACYSCHAQHGAVDNTFVQFYPTLSEVARQKGTFRDH